MGSNSQNPSNIQMQKSGAKAYSDAGPLARS